MGLTPNTKKRSEKRSGTCEDEPTITILHLGPRPPNQLLLVPRLMATLHLHSPQLTYRLFRMHHMTSSSRHTSRVTRLRCNNPPQIGRYTETLSLQMQDVMKIEVGLQDRVKLDKTKNRAIHHSPTLSL